MTMKAFVGPRVGEARSVATLVANGTLVILMNLDVLGFLSIVSTHPTLFDI